MSEHFIQYIDIENYKCFQDFKAKGFKRVNLISGKNNVGKTALMEAIELNTQGGDIMVILLAIIKISSYRSQLDYIGQVNDIRLMLSEALNKFSNISFNSNIDILKLKSEKTNTSTLYKLDTNTIYNTFSLNEVSIETLIKSDLKPNSIFIDSFGASKGDLKEVFLSIQEKDREPELYALIQKLDSEVANIKVMGNDSIQCKKLNPDGSHLYQDIAEFGDGLKHYIYIILTLFTCENGYLFIDEIGNSIHYSSLDQLWEIIFTLSKEMNVQVFATTHSRECIESYCRVAEKLQDQDISFTTLVKNKTKQIKAIVMDYEVFTNSIDQGHEVRGW